MQKLMLLGFLTTVLTLDISSSHAGLLIEPLIGYSFNSNFKEDSVAANKDTGSGTSYGGRLGYTSLGFSLGIDYLNSKIELSDKNYKSDLDMNEWAAFVGFRFPILLKVYAAYILSASGDTTFQETAVEKKTFSKGSGTKVGVGFTGIPFIDVNLEYRQGTFGESEYGGVRSTDDTNYSSYLISLSAPFDF